MKILKRADGEYERVVLAELLVPETPNVYGDLYSLESIREFCYEFAKQGYGLDVQHDQVNVDGERYVLVESFIAREGDPDFIVGSWVVGALILDDELWEDILSGKINGFSFEAKCGLEPVEIVYEEDNWIASGTTEPDPSDGHVHEYTVVLGPLNKVVSGGTSITNGHSHSITTHTITNESLDHVHRFQVLVDEAEQGEGDDDEQDD